MKSETDLRTVADDAIEYARSEIETYGVPDMMLLDISLAKGEWLAELLGANGDLVDICIAMMDLKLGEAFSLKKINEHVEMSVSSAQEFLKSRIDEADLAIVVNAVRAHHGGVPFQSVEAEICANADCYRFIHPQGVFLYFTILGKRLGDFGACLDQVEAKMDEKEKIITIPAVRDELGSYYEVFKQYFNLARHA